MVWCLGWCSRAWCVRHAFGWCSGCCRARRVHPTRFLCIFCRAIRSNPGEIGAMGPSGRRTDRLARFESPAVCLNLVLSQSGSENEHTKNVKSPKSRHSSTQANGMPQATETKNWQRSNHSTKRYRNEKAKLRRLTRVRARRAPG